jgi:hypothetical protein
LRSATLGLVRSRTERWCAVPLESEDAVVVLRCSGARGDARCGSSDPLGLNVAPHQRMEENQ